MVSIMKKNTVYGYARVSTNQQDLNLQIEILENEGCEQIFTEKISGTRTDRPKFNELLGILKEGDTLIVTKIDRFARNAQHALNIITELFDKGVILRIKNMGTIENTATGRLVFGIFSAFAEFERTMIIERTKEGKEAAKKNPDFKDGRPPKFKKYQLDMAMELLETMSYTQVERELERRGINMSKSTIYRERVKRKNKSK